MTTPDYFTVSFWRATLNHVIFGSAGSAMTAWTLGGLGSADPNAHLSIPGWGVAIAALSGAILAFLLSLLGQSLPGTPGTSVVPAAKAKPSSRRVRPQANPGPRGNA